MSNISDNVNHRYDPFLGYPNLMGFEYTIRALQIMLCITSFLGNAMIIVMMSIRKNRGQQTSIMFTALAISDTLVTVFGPLRYLLYDGFGTVYFSWTMVDQKLTNVVTISAVQISSWLLVLITIERVVCVAFPLKVYNILTVRVVTAFVVVIYLFFPLINGLFVFSQSVEKSRNGRGVKYVILPDRVYPLTYRCFEFLFKFCIPIAVILPSNVFIIYKVILSESVSTNRLSRRTRVITKNVVIVCIVFIVALSPRQIYNCIRLFSIAEKGEDVLDNYIIFKIFEYFENCNAAINFYIYILAGTKFRNDFLELTSCLLPHCLRRIIIGNGS